MMVMVMTMLTMVMLIMVMLMVMLVMTMAPRSPGKRLQDKEERVRRGKNTKV